jgi:hypothetical protein
MAATVLLRDIVDALEMQFDEQLSFLDLDTGHVETVSRELLGMEEEGDDEEPDPADQEDEEWEMAKRIVSSDRFVRLPTQFDVHEWAIMEESLIPWSRTGFARTCCMPFMAPARSGISSTPCGVAGLRRIGLLFATSHCARSRWGGVRRAPHQLEVEADCQSAAD